MKRMAFYILVLALGLAALIYSWSRPKAANAVYADAPQGMMVIAHAGGGLPQGTYSNARQGFDRSAASGFTLIEVDFSAAKNGDLVLARDWDRRHYQYFSSFPRLPDALAKLFPQQAESAQDFTARKMSGALTPMDLTALLRWMEDHPDVRIVTDIKTGNHSALTQILTHPKALARPDLRDQLIPQIYSVDEFDAVRTLGFDDIIFTNYRARLSAAELAQFANSHQLFAITVPLSDISAPAVNVLRSTGAPVCTHTVNSADDAQTLSALGVDCLYTDFLLPARAR